MTNFKVHKSRQRRISLRLKYQNLNVKVWHLDFGFHLAFACLLAQVYLRRQASLRRQELWILNFIV